MCGECGERRALYASGQCQPCYRRERAQATPFVGICLTCNEPFTTKRRYRPETGRGVYCSRECKAKARIADGRAAASSRAHYYRREYGLTIEEAVAIRAGGCAICGSAGEEGRWGNLHIDHDHKTGRIRGALCSSCNSGLGLFQDDPTLLEAAMKYLARSHVDLTP